MGTEAAALCLQAGANDLGGTLMYESITRAAGGGAELGTQPTVSGPSSVIAASTGGSPGAPAGSASRAGGRFSRNRVVAFSR